MKISDELRKWCDGADVDGSACDELRVLADRIDLEMVEHERLKKENDDLREMLEHWQSYHFNMIARAKKLVGIEKEARND